MNLGFELTTLRKLKFGFKPKIGPFGLKPTLSLRSVIWSFLKKKVLLEISNRNRTTYFRRKLKWIFWVFLKCTCQEFERVNFELLWSNFIWKTRFKKFFSKLCYTIKKWESNKKVIEKISQNLFSFPSSRTPKLSSKHIELDF